MQTTPDSKNIFTSFGCAGSIALVLLLSACGDKAEKKPVTQVAAKVDGQEISIHQLNAIMAREGLSGADAKQLSHKALERLIDQQVLVNQAVDAKLDRDPTVLLKLDMARREILSQAYMEKQLAGLSKPSQDDIRKYYAEHPALFAERRIFDLQEIKVQAKPEIKQELEQMASEHRSFDEMVKYVAGRNAEYRVVEAVRPAEQIPMSLLPELAKLKDKESGFFDNQETYSLVHVRSSKKAPVSEAKAQPIIEAFLTNQKRQKIVAEEVKSMRGNSKVEYMGMFAETKKDG